MQRLAEALAGAAREAGADIRYDTEARRILTGGGRVRGVELAGGERIDARAVVFNGDCRALAAGLLGEDVTSAVRDRPAAPRSLSALTWSLVGRPQGFDPAHHTVFFGPDYPDEFGAIFGRADITDEPTIYMCAQDRGESRNPGKGGAERLFLLINAPPRSVSADEAGRYERRTFTMLERHGLSIAGIEAGPVVTTPDDFAERFPGSGGAIYGWPTHGWSGSFRRPGSRSGIAGLYLAGGTVHPGPGVPMAALSGRIAAASARHDTGRG